MIEIACVIIMIKLHAKDHFSGLISMPAYRKNNPGHR